MVQEFNGVSYDHCLGKEVIYFLQSNDFIKIGYTGSLANRLFNYPVHNPNPMQILGLVLGDRKTEALLKKTFKHLHVQGEWFRCDPELLDFLAGFKPISLPEMQKKLFDQQRKACRPLSYQKYPHKSQRTSGTQE